MGVLLGFFAFLLGACAPTTPDPMAPEDPNPSPPTSPSPPSPNPNPSRSYPVFLRMIYVIHGDADYTWHDSAGLRLHADREALKQAQYAGENTRGTEIFIFHQRPSRGGFFSGRPTDGTFYHFRAGTLVRRKNYAGPGDAPYLGTESALMREALSVESADTTSPSRTVFLYFGHEIPLRNRKGYFASNPGFELSAPRFAEGLTRLSPSPDKTRKPFDLIVLSSCYGASPVLMQALAPLTNQAVASPAYLHLSYLDTRSIVDFTRGFSWDTLPNPAILLSLQNMRNLADTLAARSFSHLKESTQTEITVGIYDLEKAGDFLRSPVYEAQATRARGGVWKDCAEDPAFDPRQAQAGTALLYQPPRFGVLKEKTTRSAWECLL